MITVHGVPIGDVELVDGSLVRQVDLSLELSDEVAALIDADSLGYTSLEAGRGGGPCAGLLHGDHPMPIDPQPGGATMLDPSHPHAEVST